MGILDAERNLTQWVAERVPEGAEGEVFRGSRPPGGFGILVRFDTGRLSAGLKEFVTEVSGVFSEPDGALDFADRIFNSLPDYGVMGFTSITPEGEVSFAESGGRFTVAGRLRAAFA